ncbi:MAG: DUF4190 domain-containing protein [Phycisphaerales bacterium]|nr:DUF4190 domain-containing protein [Phycisphaerales bacterium]
MYEQDSSGSSFDEHQPGESPSSQGVSGTITEAPQGTSGLAIASLVCSLILCCPVLTLVGVFLGIGGLFTTGSGRKRGRGLAITGLVIGLISTILWIFPAVWLGGMAMKIYAGPGNVMTEVYAGNDAAAGSEFKAGRVPSAEDFERFVTEARERYGNFISAQAGEEARSQTQDSLEFPYFFKFENRTVSGYAEFEMAENPMDGFDLVSITLEDGEAGDLTLEASGDADGASP